MLIRLADGNLPLDDEGLLKESEYVVISDKLVGFEKTNLFVADGYIYFATQCQENEGGENAKDRVWAKEIVEFYRVNIRKFT